MIFIICLLSVIAVGLAALCIFFYKNRKKENTVIEEKTFELEKRYNSYIELIDEQKDHLNRLNNKISEIGTELKHLNQRKQDLNEDIINSQEISKNAFSKYQEQLEQSYQKADEEYDKLIKKLNEDKITKTEFIQKDICEIQQELNKIKETRAAVMEAQRREELLKQEKDSFRIMLTQNELTTIEMINEIKPRLPEPRILCMLIWSTFYQKKLDTLCKKILGNKTVCGIYKITNISNNLCYIGQARDMDKRFKDHVKCGLGVDTPVGNKLYQAMKENGPESFTFELLEVCSAEQLNEKEKFYIDLYQSKDFGYNSNKGIG